MVVSMMQFVLEIPGADSIKAKRSVIKPLKERLQHKYKLSVSEVDLQDSLAFAHMGAAIVSNSKEFGESVLQKALSFIENDGNGRLHDVSIYSEFF